MKLSKLFPSGRVQPPRPSPSEIPEEKTPRVLADLDYANLRPSDLPYTVPYYTGATIDLPRTSPLYRSKSLKTCHLRAFAYASAYIAGLLHYKPTPMIQRKIILIRAPFPMVMKYGTEIQLSEASTLHFIAEKTSIPVPKVYCAFEHRGMRFILMEFVKESVFQTFGGRQH